MKKRKPGRKAIKVDALCEQSRLRKTLELVKTLTREQLTINQIMSRLDVSQRTAYRYITTVRNVFEVQHDSRKHFFIADDNCPVCKHNTTTNGVNNL